MTPRETALAIKLRLAAELADDRAAIGEIGASIAALLGPCADARDEWMRALALAFQLERWYTAVESTLVRALRTLDGEAPAGPDWHKELLRAAAVPVGDRPALMARDALPDMQELLKLRHLARHGYDTPPDIERLSEHGHRVERAGASLAKSMQVLDAWLRTCQPS